MHKLQEIQQYWENNTIYKEANTLTSFLSKTFGTVGKVTGKTLKAAKDYIITPGIISLPLSAILAAVAYNKLTTPHTVAKNMDKRLLLNTLDTEIAVARRQIADIENKRNKVKDEEKPYDRFV